MHFLPLFNLQDRTGCAQIEGIYKPCAVAILKLLTVTQLVDLDNQTGLEVILCDIWGSCIGTKTIIP